MEPIAVVGRGRLIERGTVVSYMGELFVAKNVGFATTPTCDLQSLTSPGRILGVEKNRLAPYEGGAADQYLQNCQNSREGQTQAQQGFSPMRNYTPTEQQAKMVPEWDEA